MDFSRAMVRAVYLPETDVSKVWLEGMKRPLMRFVELRYLDAVVDNVQVFEDQLRSVLPKGSRWKGVRVMGNSLLSGERDGSDCSEEFFSGVYGVYILVDFGEVLEETILLKEAASFSINGVLGEMKECNSDQGDSSNDYSMEDDSNGEEGYGVDEKKDKDKSQEIDLAERNVFRAFAVQSFIDYFCIGGSCIGVECLVEMRYWFS